MKPGKKDPRGRKDKSATGKTGKSGKTEDADENKPAESLFLPESEEGQGYHPDVYRCAECGYEQDEPGACPDHDANPLVQVISMGKNPLEPPEVDGNEDILTDIPLKDLKFRKTTPIPGSDKTATGSENLEEPRPDKRDEASVPATKMP